MQSKSEQDVTRLELIKSFILNPTVETYNLFCISKLSDDESHRAEIEELLLTTTADIRVLVETAFILANRADLDCGKKSIKPLVMQIIQSKQSSSSALDMLLWSKLGDAFSAGAKFEDLSSATSKDDPDFLCFLNGKNSWQLAAYCYKQSLLINQKNNLAWLNLSICYNVDATCDGLPLFLRNDKPLSTYWVSNTTAIHCIVKALEINPNCALSWNLLGMLFLKETTLTNRLLCSEFLPEANTWNSIQIAAYCFAQSLLINPKIEVVWNNLANVSDNNMRLYLPYPVKDILLLPVDRPYPALKAYCYGRSLQIKLRQHPIWFNLAQSFNDGAKFIDLPLSFAESKFPSSAKGWSVAQLMAYCHVRALQIQPLHVETWANLGLDLYHGAKIEDLPQGMFKKVDTSGESEIKNLHFALYCIQKALQLCTNEHMKHSLRHNFQMIKNKLENSKIINNQMAEEIKKPATTALQDNPLKRKTDVDLTAHASSPKKQNIYDIPEGFIPTYPFNRKYFSTLFKENSAPNAETNLDMDVENASEILSRLS